MSLHLSINILNKGLACFLILLSVQYLSILIYHLFSSHIIVTTFSKQFHTFIKQSIILAYLRYHKISLNQTCPLKFLSHIYSLLNYLLKSKTRMYAFSTQHKTSLNFAYCHLSFSFNLKFEQCLLRHTSQINPI